MRLHKRILRQDLKTKHHQILRKITELSHTYQNTRWFSFEFFGFFFSCSLYFSVCCFLFVCLFFFVPSHLVLYSIVCETAAEYLKFSGRLYFFCPSACAACHQLRSVLRFNFDLCQCWSVMCPSVHAKLNMKYTKEKSK